MVFKTNEWLEHLRNIINRNEPLPPFLNAGRVLEVFCKQNVIVFISLIQSSQHSNQKKEEI